MIAYSKRSLALAAALLAVPLAAQGPHQLERVLDVNTTPRPFSSAPTMETGSATGGQFLRSGGYLYFNATAATGRELYRCTDAIGSAELIKDIQVGSADSDPFNHTAVSSGIYFTADDGVHGRELWRTDGTEQGTQMVADLTPGSGSSRFSFRGFAQDAVSGQVFFFCDAGLGMELYVTDGTAAGTNLVLDINPGMPSARIRWVHALPNGGVVFNADDGTHGEELWISDGSAAGTRLLFEFTPGGKGSDVGFQAPITWNGAVYFVATDGDPLLCRTDGVTTEVVDTLPSPGSPLPPRLHFVFGNRIWFSTDGLNGDLFSSDGSLGGAVPFRPAGRPSFWGFTGSTVSNDGSTLYIATTEGTYVTDGNAATIRSIPSGWSTSLAPIGSQDAVVVIRTPSFQSVLYRIDAMANLTPLEVLPGPESGIQRRAMCTAINGSVVFERDDEAVGDELFVTDGTLAGTAVLEDIDPRVGTDVLRSKDRAAAVDRAFFGGTGAGIGGELWVTDGTAGGTRSIDVRTGPESSDPEHFAVLGNDLLFAADDGIHGEELWFSDGTPSGTRLVLDIRNGSEGSSITDMVVLDGVAYFRARTDSEGAEPWRSDGTSAGTYRLRNIASGSADSSPFAFVVSDRLVYFVADDGVHGRELWRTDGTEVGTILVSDLRTGSEGSGPYEVRAMPGGGVVFAANATDDDRDVFLANDQVVSRITTASALGGRVNQMAVTDQGRIFIHSDPSSIRSDLQVLELSTGGAQLTLLKSFPDFQDILFPLYAFKNGLLFEVRRGGVWYSDGTVAGTLSISPESNLFDGLAVGDTFYFDGQSEAEGEALWQTDGTVAGTFEIEVFTPGPVGGNPEDFFLMHGDLYLFADADGRLDQLFALRRPGASAREFGLSSGVGPRALTTTAPVLGQQMRVTVSGPSNAQLTYLHLDPPNLGFDFFGYQSYAIQTPWLVLPQPRMFVDTLIPNLPSLIDGQLFAQAFWLTHNLELRSSRGVELSFDIR